MLEVTKRYLYENKGDLDENVRINRVLKVNHYKDTAFYILHPDEYERLCGRVKSRKSR